MAEREWLREPLCIGLPPDVNAELVGLYSDSVMSLGVVLTWRKTEYRFVRIRRELAGVSDSARLRRAHRNMIENFVSQFRHAQLAALCSKLLSWTTNPTVKHVLSSLGGTDELPGVW